MFDRGGHGVSCFLLLRIIFVMYLYFSSTGWTDVCPGLLVVLVSLTGMKGFFCCYYFHFSSLKFILVFCHSSSRIGIPWSLLICTRVDLIIFQSTRDLKLVLICKAT